MERPDLEAIRKRAEAATDGPWDISRSREIGPVSKAHDQSYGMVCGCADTFGNNSEPDGEFIAGARQDIPDLLAYVEHLEKALEQATRIAKLEAYGHLNEGGTWVEGDSLEGRYVGSIGEDPELAAHLAREPQEEVKTDE